jgi:XTP/dITP diphosphohydrolase
MRLLVATRNPHKLQELAELLAGLPLICLALTDAGIAEEIAEVGATFQENALLKAEGYARLSGLTTLADDSGLQVDALDGEPGVFSARWAGPEATDRDRIDKLLSHLQGVPQEKRQAQFRCVVAIVTPGGDRYTTEGICRGVIVDQPRGRHGFGYDPVFLLPERGLTMAELVPEEKNQISHRARAIRAARPILARLARRQRDPDGYHGSCSSDRQCRQDHVDALPATEEEDNKVD